jgi:hypothetical protein
LFNAVTNKRQHRSSIDLEHKPLLFRVLPSAQFCPTRPVILEGANTMSSPIFRSAVIACLYDVVISSVAERPSKERPDTIVERAKDGLRFPFQNLKADPEYSICTAVYGRVVTRVWDAGSANVCVRNNPTW